MGIQKKVLYIYDDRIRPNNNIINVVGDSFFGDILYKREKLFERMKRLIMNIDIPLHGITIVKSDSEFKMLLNNVELSKQNLAIVHIMSYAVVIDQDCFQLALRKSFFSENVLVNEGLGPYVFFAPNYESYQEFASMNLDYAPEIMELLFSNKKIIKPNNFCINIFEFQNFLAFFSGGFEARYFNSLQADDFTITKKSNDKLKMKKEHDLYQFLPNEMKNWFVAPYNFIETDQYASYTMERLNIPDMALQWIHSAVSTKEFSMFLDKILHFVRLRTTKPINEQLYKSNFHTLYYTKVIERIESLKKLPQFMTLSQYIATSTEYESIDAVFDVYKELYDTVNLPRNFYSVIGHGDLCFSNILFDKNSMIIKLIDPKGAIKKEEIWMDPYYDIAKLSHSINGCYDFINNDMFSIVIDSSLKANLQLDIGDLTLFKEIFNMKLKENGFDVKLVRLCEASLFLSMLPLHIDHPRKVFGFILNAINILKELKEYGE